MLWLTEDSVSRGLQLISGLYGLGDVRDIIVIFSRRFQLLTRGLSRVIDGR